MASRPYERDASPSSCMLRSWQVEATDEISLQGRRSALAFLQHSLTWQQLPVSVHADDLLIQEVQWLVDWHVEFETAI